jgi:DNA modification methylase
MVAVVSKRGKAKLIKRMADLTPDARNANKGTERGTGLLESSLRTFGAGRSVLADRNGKLIAGNKTVEGAASIGIDDIIVVPTDGKKLVVVQRTDLDLDTDKAARELAIADNRVGQVSLEWDAAELEATAKEFDIDLESLGFSEKEMAGLLKAEPAEIVEDEIPDNAPARCKAGDLWQLGEHRLLCGDSTKAADVGRLMGGEKAALCFTSPPYGQQREYTKESKDKGEDWDTLMRGVFSNLLMADDGQVLVNLGLIHRDGEWLPYWDGWIGWMREQGWRRFGWYVWDHGPGLPGDWAGRFAPAHEFVFHFNRKARKPNKSEECKFGGQETGKRTFRNGDGSLDGFTQEGAAIQSHKIGDSVIRITRQHGHGLHSDHPAVFPVGFPAKGVQDLFKR